ncbi:hypothetical protein [Paenarthrobacter sp. YJN-5]|uniref:hypothetical protein n=1 Tax=Paenarthrobacter sp. YJN-5 TaxID=2735316 RepID=UPI0018787499|nr:hypothetical protein [Paenarthrobacter sp. YJN-5]QOT19395.1 hypothetical protein HMI59_22340 [Paenarthrobacter sp. YJN-5]
MSEPPVDGTDPPLTCRELRRREEAARAPQPAPESCQEQLPPRHPNRLQRRSQPRAVSLGPLRSSTNWATSSGSAMWLTRPS